VLGSLPLPDVGRPGDRLASQYPDNFLEAGWTGFVSLQEIINGEADACFRSFGAGLVAWDRRLFLRIYWKFNANWFPWSGPGSLFISAWQRTVDVLRSAGVRKASFVWAAASSQCCFKDYYPGHRYLDWVAADGYNWNSPTSWCTTHAGWCQFR
jgi:beta-mannanase